MKAIKTIREYRKYRRGLKGKIGFVPTMGYLHHGHISLINQARKDCDHVIVSIFVNPTQFAPEEDLLSYPRDIEKDKDLCRSAGVDALFLPGDKEMYPGDESTWVIVEGITKKLEGKSRPTHFRGVTTIVTKLFNIIEPDIAYFGQKDMQQSVVIKKMAKDLDMDIMIRVCPIVRETDGLALSSRNKYLTETERKAASILYESLKLGTELFRSGERDAESIKQALTKKINSRIKGIGRIDYLSITDENLDEVNTVKTGDAISMAVYFGRARLIDNVIL